MSTPYKFSLSALVQYKGNRYIIIGVPDAVRVKSSDEWVPGYAYIKANGDDPVALVFVREQADFERKFEFA